MATFVKKATTAFTVESILRRLSAAGQGSANDIAYLRRYENQIREKVFSQLSATQEQQLAAFWQTKKKP